jgi:signal transduction histidine kinase
MSKLRPESSPARLRSAGASVRSLPGRSEGDLLADLLGRLTGLLNPEREDPAAEAAAARVSAAEIRRFAIRAKSADMNEELNLLADLLLGPASAVEKSERRWLRLSFDLHDGPHQQIAALRMQLAILTSQAAELDRQLQALDAGLAETVRSFDSPPLGTDPFEHSLEQILFDFTDGTGVPVIAHCQGRLRLADPIAADRAAPHPGGGARERRRTRRCAPRPGLGQATRPTRLSGRP